MELQTSQIIKQVRSLQVNDTETLRSLRKEWTVKLKNESVTEILRIAFELLNEGNIDFRFIAYELIHFHRDTSCSLNASLLRKLGGGLDSWGAVDMFACYLSGPAWREKQALDSLIHSWAGSRDRWWRRAALVSTVPLNSKARGGTGDSRRTLEVCRMLVRDHDDMVVKALSWALRELAKRDPTSVSKFIEKNRSKLASRVKREVENKLTTGRKNR
ncbi:DNA alkylation repair protein [bacterium]|nr:DNA alkylation repair protein [bacterium]